jgi:hypothetical protein
MLDEWTKGVIVSMYKKEDKKLCHNYGEIMHWHTMNERILNKTAQQTITN